MKGTIGLVPPEQRALAGGRSAPQADTRERTTAGQGRQLGLSQALNNLALCSIVLAARRRPGCSSSRRWRWPSGSSPATTRRGAVPAQPRGRRPPRRPSAPPSGAGDGSPALPWRQLRGELGPGKPRESAHRPGSEGGSGAADLARRWRWASGCAKGDHPFVAIGLDNLGKVRFDLGRQAEGVELLTQALAMRRRLFKGPHPDSRREPNNLAWVPEGKGRPWRPSRSSSKRWRCERPSDGFKGRPGLEDRFRGWTLKAELPSGASCSRRAASRETLSTASLIRAPLSARDFAAPAGSPGD